jgi:hypothetical protein
LIDALSFTSRTVLVGGEWVLRVLIRADDFTPSGVAPTVTVTDPSGAVAAPTATSTVSGVWRATYVPAVAGRHTAVVSSPELGQVAFVAHASSVTDGDDMPDVDAVNNYIGEHSFTDQQVQDTLDQETGAQFDVCRVPAAYPPALRGALLRRVQRSLAMRHLALAVRQSEDGESQIVIPGRDPEIRRLEMPYRKVTVG